MNGYETNRGMAARQRRSLPPELLSPPELPARPAKRAPITPRSVILGVEVPPWLVGTARALLVIVGGLLVQILLKDLPMVRLSPRWQPFLDADLVLISGALLQIWALIDQAAKPGQNSDSGPVAAQEAAQGLDPGGYPWRAR